MAMDDLDFGRAFLRRSELNRLYPIKEASSRADFAAIATSIITLVSGSTFASNPYFALPISFRS